VLRLNPSDAARRRLAEGELLRLSTRRGQLVLPLKLDAKIGPAQADLAMHWGGEFLGVGINELMSGARCPDSQQPELKFSALAVEPAQLPWRVSACAYLPAADAEALRSRLRALMAEPGYAHCLPAPDAPAGQRGWMLEAAFAEAPPPAWVQRLTEAVGLAGDGVHRYADGSRGRLRLLRLQGDALQALLRIGEHDEAAWLVPLWQGQQPARPLGRWLLSPGSPPMDALAPPRAPQVCNCFDVREDTIRACLAVTDGSLAALQAALKCGTQCGSCLPALRRLVAEQREPA
jgi:assimilatory nitrate reductase catalytic subunit